MTDQSQAGDIMTHIYMVSGKAAVQGMVVLVLLVLLLMGFVSAVPCTPQGPIEPTGIKEAGTFYKAGSYVLK